MHATRLILTFATFLLATLAGLARAVTIDWVTVGDPGNAADTTGYGAVAEGFRIMTYEWTNSQYVEFLNAVDPDGLDPQDIYSNNMRFTAPGRDQFHKRQLSRQQVRRPDEHGRQAGELCELV